MSKRNMIRSLACLASLAALVSSTGCFSGVVAPNFADRPAPAPPVTPQQASKPGRTRSVTFSQLKRMYREGAEAAKSTKPSVDCESCTATPRSPEGECSFASPDITGDEWIDASDLASFMAARGAKDVQRADFNGDGRVDGADRRILEALYGKAYVHSCEPLWTLPVGCHPYASPDLSGDGRIDASDVAAFDQARSHGDASVADFNGDGLVDKLDEIIIKSLVGSAYSDGPCTSP